MWLLRFVFGIDEACSICKGENSSSCSACDGTGTSEGERNVRSGKNGNGKCYFCNGSGIMHGEDCPVCNKRTSSGW